MQVYDQHMLYIGFVMAVLTERSLNWLARRRSMYGSCSCPLGPRPINTDDNLNSSLKPVWLDVDGKRGDGGECLLSSVDKWSNYELVKNWTTFYAHRVLLKSLFFDQVFGHKK